MANVVVGVTGGVAAYKAASLIRLFTESGHSVQVVATLNAMRFIGKATLEALSHSKVEIVEPGLFTDVENVKHVAIAKGADLIVVAPATASFIAKIAAGLADDLLTTTVLAAKCPVVIAPAMHTEMWENQATTANIATLSGRGISIVKPSSGRLTGEDTGVGRLAEPEEIFSHAIGKLMPKNLLGVRVLVTTGGTRERIDPARFIGNYSSGKQGIAFAKAASDKGALVTVIAANVPEGDLLGFKTVRVESAADLQGALQVASGSYDLLIMAAAVADFRPRSASETKLKRTSLGDSIFVDLIANDDILQRTTTEIRSNGINAVVVGFAAEAGEELESSAEAKLVSKGCDFVVANDISNGSVFGSDHNSVILVSTIGSERFSGSKYEVARMMLDVISGKVGKIKKGAQS